MFLNTEKIMLFSFFIILILLGTGLLLLPGMWGGEGRVSVIDALFTSTSAVCVTGLITLDTAQFTFAGKIVIMLLIQFGGLGIISFSTVYLTFPNRKRSFHSVNIIRKYYLDSVGHDVVVIIRNIVFFTLFFELAGALVLYFSLGSDFFTALFHSISAFCNAGFSLFSDNLEGYGNNSAVLVTIMVLVIFGGIGFVVINDIIKFVFKKKHLSIYSKIMLITTLSLIFFGALGFFFFECNNAFSGFSPGKKILNSIFQSVTPRTAGFNTVPQEILQKESQFLTLPLMFIGGGSGSIAGGIKVSTFAIIIIALFRAKSRRNKIRIGNRNIPVKTMMDAFILAGKAILLLSVSIILLLIAEGNNFKSISIIFECFSAFGTVGLSHGLTPLLGSFGKAVLILTMFSGRVGIISMALFNERNFKDVQVQYPEEEVLLG